MTLVNENVTQNGNDAPKAPLGLKILVVALGIAIIVMLGLIIWKVMAGDHKKSVPATVPGVRMAPKEHAQVPENVEASYFDLTVTRPAKSELVRSTVAELEVVLHFRSATADTIIVINRATGKESRITVPK